jgi:hypothetical protein
MFEWLTAVISPIIGAGAGSVFSQLFSKKPRAYSPKEPPPGSMAAVNRQLAELQEWQEGVETLLKVQERQIRRLKQEIRFTRFLFYAVLLAFAAVAAAWFLLSPPPNS